MGRCCILNRGFARTFPLLMQMCPLGGLDQVHVSYLSGNNTVILTAQIYIFVDFSKAFDTVGRTWLWQLLRKYGCPEKFTTMIEALHTGMVVNVRVGGKV